jgi:hypothetical protein
MADIFPFPIDRVKKSKSESKSKKKILEELKKLNIEDMAVIKPISIKFVDIDYKWVIDVQIDITPFHSIVRLNDRTFYFERETGEYDGWSEDVE